MCLLYRWSPAWVTRTSPEGAYEPGGQPGVLAAVRNRTFRIGLAYKSKAESAALLALLGKSSR